MHRSSHTHTHRYTGYVSNATHNISLLVPKKTWSQHDMSLKLISLIRLNKHTHTPVNGPFSGTTQLSRYQKVKPIWILLKQETVNGSSINWAICKCAPHFRQITTPAPHHSVFYRPDVLPAAQPTASKHWRQRLNKHNEDLINFMLINLKCLHTDKSSKSNCKVLIDQHAYSELPTVTFYITINSDCLKHMWRHR